MSRNSVRVGLGRFIDPTSVGSFFKALSSMLIISSLLTACNHEAQGSERQLKTNARAQSGLNSGATNAPHSAWKKGMAYADFRNSAKADGWSAVVDPQCRTNVIGENYVALCSAHAELDDCRVCDDMPELGSCSSDGYCGMTFSRQTQKLKVTTYGMTDDRKVLGDKSRLQVVGWTIETKRP